MISYADKLKGKTATPPASITTTTPVAKNDHLKNDFPELSSNATSQIKSEPIKEVPSNIVPAPTTQGPSAAKLVSADGDKAQKAAAQAPQRKDERNPFKKPYDAKPKSSYENRPRQERPRSRSSSNGGWSRSKYFRDLEEETKIYRQRFNRGNTPAPIFQVINGDLFESDKSFALAHCISLDYKMGAGIAKIFRDKFAKTEQDIEGLKAQNQGIGGCSHHNKNGRDVFYITKEFYYAKPFYADVEKSLVKLRELCEANKLSSLAMPRIAAGLDGLNWRIIENIINHVFAGTQMKIQIYDFKPEEGKDERKERPRNSDQQRKGPGPGHRFPSDKPKQQS